MREPFLLITLHFVPFPLLGKLPLGKNELKKYLHKNTKICMHAHAKERLLKEEYQNTRKTTNDYSFQKTLYRLAFRSD